MNPTIGLQKQRQQELLLAMLDHQGLLNASAERLAGHRACSFGQTLVGSGGSYYPRSIFSSNGLLFFLARLDRPLGSNEQQDPQRSSKRLFIVSKDTLPGVFQGTSQSMGGRRIFEGELSYDNYLATAEYLPFMKPSSLRDKTTTIGCGDRLGASNPGHIRAARNFDISPVLAQQSIRELTLTGRTYPQVVREIGRASCRERV